MMTFALSCLMLVTAITFASPTFSDEISQELPEVFPSRSANDTLIHVALRFYKKLPQTPVLKKQLSEVQHGKSKKESSNDQGAEDIIRRKKRCWPTITTTTERYRDLEFENPSKKFDPLGKKIV